VSFLLSKNNMFFVAATLILPIEVQPNYCLMKKIVITACIVLLLVLAGIYLLIPNRIVISQQLAVAANREALFRNLGNEVSWGKWWPGEKMGDSGSYSLNGIHYKLQDAKILSLPVIVSDQQFRSLEELTFIGQGPDSTVIHLDGLMPTSYNPFNRVRAFFKANQLKKNAAVLLQAIKTHYAGIESLYAYDIQKKSVVDSTLLTNIKEVKGKPSVAAIYSCIDELRNYIHSQGAHETGNPMLNIFTKDNINYLLKVAIPVDRKLSSSGTMAYRWMLGGGNILITEVKGSQAEIDKAYKQIEYYISDYKRIAPAIPFESLVTDRRKETDSTKWITRIYYPVM
jgi:hypothetical protein